MAWAWHWVEEDRADTDRQESKATANARWEEDMAWGSKLKQGSCGATGTGTVETLLPRWTHFPKLGTFPRSASEDPGPRETGSR